MAKKQTAIRIDEELLKKGKLHAIEENVPFQTIVERALNRYLAPKSNAKEIFDVKLNLDEIGFLRHISSKVFNQAAKQNKERNDK